MTIGEKFSRMTSGAGDRAGLESRTTHLTEGEVAGVRTRIEGQLGSVRANARSRLDETVARTRRAANATDEYVHHNPWSMIGAVALTGLAIGALLNRR
jgi:ElaB/YqjD/DUF883 family membrane-anchored ribosome-binding protein